MPKNKDFYVFSHNDLLPNNILISTESDNIIFIDFEYT